MDNPFSRCNTQAEIMKMIFELSAQKKYTRQQLNVMAAARREELLSVQKSGVELVKISVPTEDVFQTMKDMFITFTSNPRISRTFEFLGSGLVRF